jgi:hypothetical protein
MCRSGWRKPELARLAGIEPTFGQNPLEPAPALDFAKSSRLKNVEKWMTQVDDIRRQF